MIAADRTRVVVKVPGSIWPEATASRQRRELAAKHSIAIAAIAMVRNDVLRCNPCSLMCTQPLRLTGAGGGVNMIRQSRGIGADT